MPEDLAARHALLERWAAEKEQERARSPRARLRRLRVSIAYAIAKQVVRLDRLADRILDRRLHTSLPLDAVPETANADGTIYVASPWHVVPRALRAVGACDHDVFVDFGCGKGRVVHQAARR